MSPDEIPSAREATLAKWHARFVVALAATIPVGEGLAIAALLGVGVLLVLRRESLRPAALLVGPGRPVISALAVWLVAGLAAIALGGEGWQRPSELGRHLPLLAIPALLLSAQCLPRRTLRQATLAFVVALTVAAAFGLVQYGFNIRPGESLARIDSTVASQGRVPGRYDRSVAGGFYFHRLKLAHVLVVGVALLAARQLYAGLSRRRRLLEAGFLAVMGVAFMLTFTRGALLALGVGGVACVPFVSRRLRLVAVAALLAAALVAVAIPSVRHRLGSASSEGASAVRSLIWSQGVRIVADHPFGVGLGNYPSVVSRYYDTADPAFTVRTYPHDLWLAAWAETGPVGLVAFALAWAYFLVACARRLRAPTSYGDEPGRVAAFTGLFAGVTTLAIGVTHDVLYHNAVALAFAAMVGLVLVELSGEPGQAGAGGQGAAAGAGHA